MLSVLSGTTRDCEGIRRRSFLQIGALAGLGISLPDLLARQQALAAERRPGRDVNCILIWTQGGTSHHDTFDPKPEAPAAVRGPFGVIDTPAAGVKFTEILPRMAKEQGRFALLRSWNPRNGSHGTADAYVMSGHPYTPAVTYPCFGAVVSQELGFKTAMPPFAQLGANIDRRFGGGSPGYLGLEHAAFELLADPSKSPFVVRDITPPKTTDAARIDRRRSMLAAIDAVQQRTEAQPDAYRALDEYYRAAFNMVTSPETKRAFDLDAEDGALRDRYGRTKFGQSLLLARRLIEGGVRFVTVTDGGWDTHQKNFDSLKDRLIPPVDQALPELLIDLEQRGLLDSTLVVWLTDFGRTPKINSASGRDHWSTAGFAIMAGAGVPGGAVLGKTDGEGGRPLDDEYLSQDIAATVYTKLGIPLDTIHFTPDGRPMRLNEGRVIKEWM
ncbi:MAG TPA: DUF1501 domain-containing protein [Pirellulales bacterium]|nr:DUF1501 domain-containing protein [Pirellulales bacterium]